MVHDMTKIQNPQLKELLLRSIWWVGWEFRQGAKPEIHTLVFYR